MGVDYEQTHNIIYIYTVYIYILYNILQSGRPPCIPRVRWVKGFQLLVNEYHVGLLDSLNHLANMAKQSTFRANYFWIPELKIQAIIFR